MSTMSKYEVSGHEKHSLALSIQSVCGTGGGSFHFRDCLTGRFPVVGTCPGSLGKNEAARYSFVQMELAISIAIAVYRGTLGVKLNTCTYTDD